MNNEIQRAFLECAIDARFGGNVPRASRDELFFRAGWSAAKAHTLIELRKRGVLSDTLFRLLTERDIGREEAESKGTARKGRGRVKDVCSADARS